MSNAEYHRSRFGNHPRDRRIRCFHLPGKDELRGLVSEQVHWALYDVPALSFGVRFVLVAASEHTWSLGDGAICGGLLCLIRDFGIEIGLPTTVGPRPSGDLARAIWVLQAPNRTYHLVAYDNKQHRVWWSPVFSMDPIKDAGSIDALRMLFPVDADEGTEAFELNFWAPRK